MAAPASPFQRLQPWTHALSQMATLRLSSDEKHVRDACETWILWATWPSVEAFADVDAEKVERAHEALEMLALLSQNRHYDAWAAFLIDVWPNDAPRWLDVLPSWRTHGLRVGCSATVERPTFFTRWAETYVQIHASDESIARAARWRRLLAKAFSIPDLALAPTCAVPTHLEIYTCWAVNRANATAVLLEVVSVVKRQHTIDRSLAEEAAPVSRRFELVAVWLMKDLDWNELQCVDVIVRHGIHVAMLPLYNTHLDPLNATTYTPMLRNLFASSPRHDRGSSTGASVVELVSTMSRDTAFGIFSALLDSQSIREIGIARSPLAGEMEIATVNEKIWEWLALSVLSHQATNQVDCLTIDVDGLTLQDVAAMQSLVRAPNPLAAFFGNPLQTDCTVLANRFWLSDDPGQGPELALDADAFAVRVVDDRRDDWVGVLLPGYGRAWLPRSQCQLSMARLPPTTTGQCRAIREIGLYGLEPTSLPVAASVLHMVGKGIRHLSLIGKGDTNPKIPNAWYRDIWRQCPALDAFTTNGVAVESIDILFELLSQDIPRVRQLSLHLIQPNTVRVVDLFDALADENKVMTQRLTSLSVRLDVPNDTPAELAAALHRMLASNYYLQDVRVVAYQSMTVSQGPASIDSSVGREYDGEAVYGRRGPLPLTAKLALLSVVATHLLPHVKRHPPSNDDRGVTRVMHQLDQHVLTRIFEFAAQSKTRQVYVAIETV